MDVAGAAYLVGARALDALNRYRQVVVEARGPQRAAIAALAGACSVLAFAPFFLWPVLFLTIPVLVWLMDAAWNAGSQKLAAWGWWWFGFGYFFAGLFWIGEAFLVEADKFAWALPFAITLLPAGLALFFAGAAAVAYRFWGADVWRVVVLALAIGAADWLRGHVLTGFPWASLGYALTVGPVMMQSAGLLGIYALSIWAGVIFAAPLVLGADVTRCANHSRANHLRGLVWGASLSLGLLVFLNLYGQTVLLGASSGKVSGVRMRLVQPSIPQTEKWKPEQQGAIFREHLDLSVRDERGVRDDLAGITHLIWAEAAMPFLPLEHPEALAAIADILPAGAELVSGALRREKADVAAGQRAFNSMMVFDDGGGLRAVYDKTHLVPFGEYLPFHAFLESIGFEQLSRMRGGFTEGATPRPLLQLSGMANVGGLICYEAIFPGVGARAAGRPQLFINITNDGWFGATTGPYQHFHQARVRAVEEGVPIVRVANNGISGLIDPYGLIVASLDLNRRGVLDVDIPLSVAPPPYSLYGDWIYLLNFMFFFAALVWGRLRALRRTEGF